MSEAQQRRLEQGRAKRAERDARKALKKGKHQHATLSEMKGRVRLT